MKDAPHPGLIILHDCIKPLGLNVEQAAEKLGVDKGELADVVNCRVPISPELAASLERGFGSTKRMWLAMQRHYDMAQALNRGEKIEVQKVESKQSIAAA